MRDAGFSWRLILELGLGFGLSVGILDGRVVIVGSRP
jgi:hypothetical protein